MFGLTTYIAGGAVAASLAFGGYQMIRAQGAILKLERAQTSEAAAKAALANCASRLSNIQEAAASNATIPDDLSDFDIPDHWMSGPDPDTAGDD